MTDLGNAVANFARLVPDGLLVFFPSYAVLTKCTEHWKQDISNGAVLGIWGKPSPEPQPLVGKLKPWSPDELH
jgi:regulator of telomere elongation helicase 1